MGCDIHGWIEIKKDDKWIAIRELPENTRNYRRFSALAGVRGHPEEWSEKPLGIPDDASETTRFHYESWGTGAHSHSYMNIHKAVEIFLESDYSLDDFKNEYPLNAYFGIESNQEELETRLVFWFDS